MAEYRTVQSKVWRDDWFSEQAPDAKLLFMYLFTNSAASVSGIYQLPLKFIAFETGVTQKRASELLKKFQADGKIEWCEPIIWVRKMRDYQATKSPQVQVRIDKDFKEIPDCPLKTKYGIQYGIYPIDTVSVPNPESASDTDTDTDTERETDTETETETNPGASAPDGGSPPVSARKPTERQSQIKTLETAFVTASGLSAPKADAAGKHKTGVSSWWQPLGEILELAHGDVVKAESFIQQSVQKLTAIQYTIASPKSIVNTARGLSRANGANGPPANEPAGFQAMRDYMKRKDNGEFQ